MMKLEAKPMEIPERPADAKIMKLEMVETGASAMPQAPAQPQQTPEAQALQAQARELMSMLGAQAQANSGQVAQQAQPAQETLPSVNLMQHMLPLPAFIEKQPPANLSPEDLQEWKNEQETKRRMHNELQRLQMERRKNDFARLEAALQQIIPTAAGTISGFNADNLAKIYANTDQFDPAAAEALVNILDVGAAAAKKSKKMEYDVNQLQKQLEEKGEKDKLMTAKLEELIQKVQALEQQKKPLIAQNIQPAPQSVSVIPPAQPQMQMELTGASKIFAANLQKAQGPYQDLSAKSIQESAKRLARLFSETN